MSKRLIDEELDPTLLKLSRKVYVDFDKRILQEAINHIGFLEDERQRCYRELEEYEVEIGRLKDKVEHLLNEQAGYVWDEMRSSAIDQKKKESMRRLRWR